MSKTSTSNTSTCLIALSSFASGAAIAYFLSSRLVRRQKLQHIATHDPSWVPGKPQHGPYCDLPFIPVDPEALGGTVCYPLVISAGVPRPIAFISSLSKDGSIGNLAPYSYFNMVAHDPPHVAIGMCHTAVKAGGKKDSLTNILDSGYEKGMCTVLGVDVHVLGLCMCVCNPCCMPPVACI